MMARYRSTETANWRLSLTLFSTQSILTDHEAARVWKERVHRQGTPARGHPAACGAPGNRPRKPARPSSRMESVVTTLDPVRCSLAWTHQFRSHHTRSGLRHVSGYDPLHSFRILIANRSLNLRHNGAQSWAAVNTSKSIPGEKRF